MRAPAHHLLLEATATLLGVVQGKEGKAVSRFAV